jgi:Holliday junction resolvase-like predicted endonuclease
LAPDGREYAFVEVRTRHGLPGLAEGSISRRKATSMASAAYDYLSSRNLDPDATPWRIDLVAISMSGDSVNSINWIQGAISEEMLNDPG